MKSLKISQITLLSVLVLTIALGSCKKSEQIAPEAPKSIFDVQASASFNWKTDKEYTLAVKGAEVPVTIKNNLVIQSADGKAVYYTGPAEMNKDYSIRFATPAYVKQIKVTFGTIAKTMDLTGSSLTFSFISE